MTQCEQYARWVLDPENERETGRLIKLAAQRFVDDLKRDDIYFDEVEAVKMPDFCEEFLHQWEGDFEGLPLSLQGWQRFIFEQVFGWMRRDNGNRRFTEVYVQISKKQGKSTMAAGLMDYHVFGDERVRTPKVFTAANNEDQAKICVNMAGRIIEASPVLAEMYDDKLIGLMTYKENITEVINYENNGFIKAFSKETSDKKSKTAGGKHGVNASLGVIDEFGMSPDHGASGAIKSSMASRGERLMFYITTAGYNMDGPCYKELRKVGIEVLEGSVIKDNYLPIIYEIDPPIGEDGKEQSITVQWLQEHEEVWRQASPNLDVSVNREFLREQLADAITYGGLREVEVLTLNFNRWVDSPEVFISSEIWDTNSHELEISDGEDCFVGMEIGASGQASAVCFLFPGDIVRIKMLYFMAGEALKTNEIFNSNKDFVKIDPGNEVEVSVAVDWILEEFQKYNVRSLCYPITQKNNSIVQGVLNSGYNGYPISQGVNSISNPTEEWEKLLRAGQIDHFKHPILKWQNSNCLAIRKEQGTRIQKSGSVLGIYACINAVAQWKTESADEIEVDTNFTML
jgi:phage terminase large subunit-like protein